MTHTQNNTVPKWMTWWLNAAGVYNIVWGVATIALPTTTLGWLGIASTPITAAFWQCIGMIVGVYGLGYLIAAQNPYRHWPIVLVGLLGKIFGPIGFVQAVMMGVLPVSMGWTIITNDLLWWVPFGLILWRALDHHQRGNLPATPVVSLTQALQQVRDHEGRSLWDLTHTQPRLVVFLRHAGCTFCRQALADLQRQRAVIDQRGLGMVLVHLGDDADAAAMAARYQLSDVPRVADPQRVLFQALELQRGGFAALFGPMVFVRGFMAAIIQRHGVGKSCGDTFQLGGAFVLHEGRVIKAYRHRSAAARPGYAKMVCELPTRDQATHPAS